MTLFQRLSALLCVLLIGVAPAVAQDFLADLALEPGNIRAEGYILVGRKTRIYATVKNNSDQDLFGSVKFYDEKQGKYIGEDQPVSVLAHSTDDVFVDWEAGALGTYPISARVIPWEPDGNDPNNDKITTSIYVDIDTDKDGLPNRQDPDDDNDETPDNDDAFPEDPSESLDTDEDGVGNHVDEDDDGDGVPDIKDLFPDDPNETVDRDGDGAGDNGDVFPDDSEEWVDADQDGLGDNTDPDSNNKGPVASIKTDNTVVPTGSVITFNALNAHDLDGEIVTYEWDFGHGVESTSVVAEKIFETPGTYDVKLKVIDDKGESRETIMTITVIYRWQTIALILIILLLFLFLIYNLVNSKKALDKNKKKA